METKLFLENVGTVEMKESESVLWSIENLGQHESFQGRDIPSKIWVVDSPMGHQLLLSREMTGPKKFHLIKEVGHTMLRLIKPEFSGRVAQFVILWGGRPLDLLNADPSLFRHRLPDTTYIKLQRKLKDDKSDFVVEQISMTGKWWEDDTYILLEECTASGATLAGFIQMLLKHHKPKKVIAPPVCGSLEGIERAYRVCRENEIEFVPILNTAIIQVQKMGVKLPLTDLGLQPLTIATKNFIQKAAERYQNTALCWVGDIGDSLYKIDEFLIDTIGDMMKIGMNPEKEDWSKWDPMIFGDKFLAKLERDAPGAYKWAINVLENYHEREEH